jgi:CBS-domain-containing membrane protein
MFSVYGETGRLFKGAMEELRHVESVKAVSRARAVDPVGRFFPVGPSPQATPPAAAHAGHPNPLDAYAQAASVQPQRRPLTRVAEVMSRTVITVPAEMPVLEAWQLLGRRGVSQAPVIGMHGQLVGLLTRAELLRPDRLSLPNTNVPAWRAMLAQPVSDIMWSPMPAVDEDTDIRRVARVLLDTHLPGLPVVNEDGTVTGFVSRTDILRAVVHDPPLDLWT